MWNADCGMGNKKTKLIKSRVWNNNPEVNPFRNSESPLPSPSPSRGEGWGGGAAFQRGFTLIEIIVVIVILSIVSAIAIKFLADSLRIYTMTVNQKTLFDEGKLTLERMCRDIRDGQTIFVPAPGASASNIIFKRTNATAQDIAAENVTFQLTGTTLYEIKATPAANTPLAANVSTFTATQGTAAANTLNEITLALNLSLTGGGNVTLQTKVYPKNLPRDAMGTTYKNFCQNWMEYISP
jgi:prepilin-type N-terminal cleavage/methylation domain-containing protein